MYIYHALISSLSAHMKQINLDMIFCTHVERSPTKNNLHNSFSRQARKHGFAKASYVIYYDALMTGNSTTGFQRLLKKIYKN